MRCAPRCSTLRSLTRSDTRGSGASGEPTFPQAARKTERKRDKTMRRQGGSGKQISPHRPVAILQNVSTKVFILHDVSQHLTHVIGVHNLALLFQVGAFKRNLVEDFLQDRVQAARAYVFGGLVDLESEVCHFVNRVFGDFASDAFGLHQRLSSALSGRARSQRLSAAAVRRRSRTGPAIRGSGLTASRRGKPPPP